MSLPVRATVTARVEAVTPKGDKELIINKVLEDIP
jgi:hypothetical protein